MLKALLAASAAAGGIRCATRIRLPALSCGTTATGGPGGKSLLSRLATAYTGVLVDKVLDDEQRRRVVIQLLAGVDADLFAEMATARTDPLGTVDQLVVLRHTWQILRQTAATMRPALPLGLLLAGRRGTRRERIRRKVGEEQEVDWG